MSTATPRKTEEVGRKLAALYAPIAAEMAEAEHAFAAELGSRHPFVQHLADSERYWFGYTLAGDERYAEVDFDMVVAPQRSPE